MQVSMLPVLLAIIVIRLGEYQGWLPVWARSYGDDLAVLPFVLWVIRFIHRKLRDEPQWLLPPSHGFLAVAFYIMIFEWVLPSYWGRGTSDPLDAVFYCLGLGYFQFIVNAPATGISLKKKNPILS